jgi:hypothetical protein
MATEYWTGTQWVLQDGTVTTAPGIGDVGVLGGPSPSGLPPLAQSGTVSFFGETTTDIGVLTVAGAGPWTIEGTGGTASAIENLIVAMGATVTVKNDFAVHSVVVQQTPGITTPATVTLNNGLAPGDAIDFQSQPGLTYTSAFNGTFTNIIVSSGSAVVGNVSLIGNVQLGPTIGDGAGGTEIVVQGTQPFISTPQLILNTRSVNDIGRGTGEFVVLGFVNAQPNGDQGTTVSAASITNPSTGQPYRVIPLVFNPSPSDAILFTRSIAYDPTNPADNYFVQPWTLTFTNGTATETATTPSLVGVTPAPFASNVTFSGLSTNPTFTWNYPSGSINGVGFNIIDDTSALGRPLVVFSTVLRGTTGTFTVPSALDGGLTLQQGHHYTLDLDGIISRDPTQPVSYRNDLADSDAFFDFEPNPGLPVPAVYLPTITPAGAYQFNIQVIGGQTYFIDPSIATGYTYATAAGNPNFASVLLPAIQTTAYTVSFVNNGVQETDTVAPNTLFTFPTGGVNTFTVTGVNVADNLNPANATAFVTGLTFVSSGNFTGTQTPIVTFDPGPTAGSTSITVGHNQTLDETALVNGLITPGLPGDTETVISVSGNATLSGSTITYNSRASGTDSFSYTVEDELAGKATGTVNVTVDPGPTITPVTPSVVENGQTTEIGAAASGLAADRLTLQQTGGNGALALQLVNGVEEVIYTAPTSVTAGTLDTVTYTIADQYNDKVTGSNTIPVGPAGYTIYVGTAGDSITVGNGNSVIDGRAGNETISAGNGNDVVFAGTNDTIRLGNGNDTVLGGSGDTIQAGNGIDTISTGANSHVTLGNGPDTVTVGDNSTVVLGNGTDTLSAGANSNITVGNGNDTIYAGANDLINLGSGVDTVAFGVSESPPIGNEVVKGFVSSNDVIEFNHALFVSYAAMMSAGDIAQSGSNTLITDHAGDTVTLTGAAASSLTANNFKFV